MVIGIDHDVQSCRWERTSSSGIAVRDLAHAAEKGKNNRRKLEQIPANLAKILKPFVREAGSVRPKNKLQRAMETAAARAKIEWKQNCLRHSFCSYAVALKGLEWTSDQADHSIAILKRDYREVVTKEDAKKYFSILVAKKSVKEAESTTVSAKSTAAENFAKLLALQETNGPVPFRPTQRSQTSGEVSVRRFSVGNSF